MVYGRTKIAFTMMLVSAMWMKTAATDHSPELTNKIAYLKGGEIWISTTQGNDSEKLTDTGGKIENFLFSPNRRYIAYSKIINYVDQPGLWEEGETPQCTVSSIVIKNLDDGSIIKEIFPNEWIHITKWQTDYQLHYRESSGFDVSGFCEYDIQRDTIQQLDYTEGSVFSDADFHWDGSLSAHTEESDPGEEYMHHLHLVDHRRGTDTVVASKRSILDPKISHGKNAVAFFEVEWNPETNKSFDHVWIYSITNQSLREIFTGPSKPKAGGQENLAWSLDDRYLGLFHPGTAHLLNIQREEMIHTFSGIHFQWIPNNNVLFSQGDTIFIYLLEKKEKEIFQEKATCPVFLWK